MTSVYFSKVLQSPNEMSLYFELVGLSSTCHIAISIILRHCPQCLNKSLNITATDRSSMRRCWAANQAELGNIFGCSNRCLSSEWAHHLAVKFTIFGCTDFVSLESSQDAQAMIAPEVLPNFVHVCDLRCVAGSLSVMWLMCGGWRWSGGRAQP